MNKVNIKTFIYCIVTPQDPIQFDIEFVEGEWWSWSDQEKWAISLKLNCEMSREEILYLAAREALMLMDETIDYEFLLPIMQALEVPYNVPKGLEQGEPWSPELKYSLENPSK